MIIMEIHENTAILIHSRLTYCSMSYNHEYDVILVYTSSTARGGGGSFKNRKPMGEIGCCESRMAEQKQ